MAFRAAFGLKNISALSYMTEFGFNKYFTYTSVRYLRGRSRAIDANDAFDVESELKSEQFDDELEFKRHSKSMKNQLNSMPRKPEMISQAMRRSVESEQLFDSRDNNGMRSPFWNERAKQFAEDAQFDKYGQIKSNNNNYYNNRNNRPNYKRFNDRDNEFDTRIDRDFDDEDMEEQEFKHNKGRVNTEQQNFDRGYNRRPNNGQFQNYDNPRFNNNNNNQSQRNYDRQGNQFARNNDRQYQSYDNRERNQFQRYNNNQRNQYQSYDNRQTNQYQRYDDRNNNRFQGNYQKRNVDSGLTESEMNKTYRDYNKRRDMNNFNQHDDDLTNKVRRFDSEDGRPRFRQLKSDSRTNMQTKNRPLNEEIVDDYENEVLVDEEQEAAAENAESTQQEMRERVPISYNVTMENRFEVLNQLLFPLHIKHYNQQLSIKYKKNIRNLQYLGKRLRMLNSPVVLDNNGLPCPIEFVKPSPITEKYRNNDEYSIWPGVDGNPKTVGYFIGSPSRNNDVVCVEPDRIIVSKDSHISLAKKFQNYLRDVSPYDTCRNFSEGGNWRRLHIKSNDEGEHMVIAIMHPQQLSHEELEAEKNRLKQYFDGDERVKSLYFQAAQNARSTNEEASFQLISGEKYISRTLHDKKFLISPDTFFQINTAGAQVLYSNVLSEVNANKKTTVLDLCCGAGVFASIVAPYANRVIGIDSSQSAINDAKQNTALNEIKNVTFIAGKAEDELPKLMDELYAEEIVIVANPNRSGLRPGVINAIRNIKFAHKFVYVSCKPEGTAVRNWAHLCARYDSRNKDPDSGAPFTPTNAIPVDLFPQTELCELIVTFERF